MSLADVLSNIGFGLVMGSLALYVIALQHSSPELDRLSDLVYAIGCWLIFLACVMTGALVLAVIFGAVALWATHRWWKNRRKGRGRKALRELGDKSRRRVQALVDQMSPSPIPSPAGAG